eukprot:CAMPEP_0174245570 /NCGR_PEP_ID=MMETSP0417-20130205/39726_1 /TAXON_ID=242541 /ORGANISM="Mayorella sp, Strain BSH-02190019" /LENGTH=67 /DNA_ID=CAMNT_0015325369 /DNA_START=91 /DNA_END=291 /DNA_ORIENTATION=+
MSGYSGYSYYFGDADLQDPEVYTSAYSASELQEVRLRCSSLSSSNSSPSLPPTLSSAVSPQQQQQQQ